MQKGPSRSTPLRDGSGAAELRPRAPTPPWRSNRERRVNSRAARERAPASSSTAPAASAAVARPRKRKRGKRSPTTKALKKARKRARPNLPKVSRGSLIRAALQNLGHPAASELDSSTADEASRCTSSPVLRKPSTARPPPSSPTSYLLSSTDFLRPDTPSLLAEETQEEPQTTTPTAVKSKAKRQVRPRGSVGRQLNPPLTLGTIGDLLRREAEEHREEEGLLGGNWSSDSTGSSSRTRKRLRLTQRQRTNLNRISTAPASSNGGDIPGSGGEDRGTGETAS